jgi:hypothetical protein
VISLLATIVGWAGAFLLLAAYALVSLRRLSGDGVLFQVLNIVGAAGLATVSIAGGVWPSAFVNFVWIAVGVVVLVRGGISRRRRRSVLNQAVDNEETPS